MSDLPEPTAFFEPTAPTTPSFDRADDSFGELQRWRVLPRIDPLTARRRWLTVATDGGLRRI